jgi:hypothetical protein
MKRAFLCSGGTSADDRRGVNAPMRWTGIVSAESQMDIAKRCSHKTHGHFPHRENFFHPMRVAHWGRPAAFSPRRHAEAPVSFVTVV